jgi:hypothetical protein
VSGGIYLVQGGDLVEMAEQDYASEARLQELLAKYPNLLAGDQIDGDEPRRWLLLDREVSLATEEGGPGRWSVDHLFLDQDAVPTIVEAKRQHRYPRQARSRRPGARLRRQRGGLLAAGDSACQVRRRP